MPSEWCMLGIKLFSRDSHFLFLGNQCKQAPTWRRTGKAAMTPQIVAYEASSPKCLPTLAALFPGFLYHLEKATLSWLVEAIWSDMWTQNPSEMQNLEAPLKREEERKEGTWLLAWYRPQRSDAHVYSVRWSEKEQCNSAAHNKCNSKSFLAPQVSLPIRVLQCWHRAEGFCAYMDFMCHVSMPAWHCPRGRAEVTRAFILPDGARKCNAIQQHAISTISRLLSCSPNLVTCLSINLLHLLVGFCAKTEAPFCLNMSAW